MNGVLSTCVPTQPQQQVRDQVCNIIDLSEKANVMLESLENRLFGTAQGNECDQANSPDNVQQGLNRTESNLRRLLTKLDNLLSRI
jgi:hypothetical protein